MHRSRALVAAFVIYNIIISSSKHDRIECRFLKDNTRPKSKCQKSYISSSSESSTIINNARCIALNNPYCMDIRLPYNSTYIPDYLPDLNIKSFDDIYNYLQLWKEVRKLPRCWPILQVALCSILMPQCEEDPQTYHISRIHRPSIDICNDLVNKDECRFIGRRFGWPSIFNCNDTNIFARNCTNELRDLKFSGSSIPTNCEPPLVATNDETIWFKDVQGCGFHCKSPLSNRQDQANISLFVRTLTLTGLGFTIAAILLFRVNEATSRSSKMAKVIKHCNTCQLLFYLGWSLQVFYNDDLACNSNGSALNGQPLVASPCVSSYLLTYPPSLSSLFWFAHLGRLCHMILNSERTKAPKDTELDSSLSLLIYGVPLTLSVCVAFLGHVDGHGLFGICTVGQRSIWIRFVFVFVPSLIPTLYGSYYFIKTIRLTFARSTMKPDLRRNLARIVILVSLTALQTFFTIYIPRYESENMKGWIESIDSYLACGLNLQYDNLIGSPSDAVKQPKCTLDSDPIITLLYHIYVISNLVPGIVIASWAFTASNYRGFRRRLVELLEDDRERERRTKNYLKNVDANNIGITQALLANGIGAITFKETYHDLIDITWPTSQGQHEDSPHTAQITVAQIPQVEAIPDTRRLSLENVQLSVLQGRVSHETSLSRRSSLRSTNLDFPTTTNTSNQSINLGNGIGHVIPRSNQGISKQSRQLYKYSERTSRHVINEIKRSINVGSNAQMPQYELANSQMPPNEQLNPVMLDPLFLASALYAYQFIMTPLAERLIAARLNRLPNFLHVVCTGNSGSNEEKNTKTG